MSMVIGAVSGSPRLMSTTMLAPTIPNAENDAQGQGEERDRVDDTDRPQPTAEIPTPPPMYNTRSTTVSSSGKAY